MQDMRAYEYNFHRMYLIRIQKIVQRNQGNYIMAIWVVEFSSGGTKLERFLPKNQHTQRKLLNFENWVNGQLSKSAKI